MHYLLIKIISIRGTESPSDVFKATDNKQKSQNLNPGKMNPETELPSLKLCSLTDFVLLVNYNQYNVQCTVMLKWMHIYHPMLDSQQSYEVGLTTTFYRQRNSFESNGLGQGHTTGIVPRF